MHDPTEGADADKPENGRTHKKQNRGEKSPLEELAEAGDKQAG